MCISIKCRVRIRVIILIRWHHCLGDNDGHNESVDTQDTRHDNGDNIFDNSGRMVNPHVTDAESSLPGSPGGSPGTENHAQGCSQIAAVCVREKRAKQRIELIRIIIE